MLGDLYYGWTEGCDRSPTPTRFRSVNQHALSGRATPNCTTTSVLDPPAKLYYSWGAADVAHAPVGLHERGPQPPSPPLVPGPSKAYQPPPSACFVAPTTRPPS